MIIVSKTVSKDFRDFIGRAYPGLGDDLASWRLLEYLLFSSWRDEVSDELLLPAELLACMEDKEKQYAAGQYRATAFLARFHQNVQDFSLRAQDIYVEVRVRRVLALPLPPEVRKRAAEEISSRTGERVYFATGLPFSRNKQSREREALREYSRELMRQNSLLEPDKGQVCHESARLLEYLNSLPSNRFTKILKHMDEAHRVADALERDQDHQHRLLHAISDQAQPLYKAAPSSARVFSFNESFLRLARSVRKVLTQDWITADLKSAQLGIVSRVWAGGIPSVSEFLASGKSVWPELAGWMGLELTEANKDLLKSALYAIIFGVGEKKLAALFESRLPDGTAAFGRFKLHPLIADLLHARDREMRTIRKAGFAVDAFDRSLPVTFKQPSDSRYFAHDNVRSLLSLVAQSYELRLMLPVLDLAIEHKTDSHGFVITSWLHDGITIDLNDRTDGKHWQAILGDAVLTVAHDLEIPTSLEWSPDLLSF